MTPYEVIVWTAAGVFLALGIILILHLLKVPFVSLPQAAERLLVPAYLVGIASAGGLAFKSYLEMSQRLQEAAIVNSKLSAVDIDLPVTRLLLIEGATPATVRDNDDTILVEAADVLLCHQNKPIASPQYSDCDNQSAEIVFSLKSSLGSKNYKIKLTPKEAKTIQLGSKRYIVKYDEIGKLWPIVKDQHHSEHDFVLLSMTREIK